MDGIEIKIVYPEQFKQISEQLYHQVFGGLRSREIERIDFACIFFYHNKPSGYATCYEHSSTIVYLQFGGAFPEYRSSRIVYFSYHQLIKKLLDKYSCLLTKIDSDNIPMLKLAFKCGWRIIGTSQYINNNNGNNLLVELANYKETNPQTEQSLRVSLWVPEEGPAAVITK